MSTQEHRRMADQIAASCAVLTVSDTRNATTDKGGQTIKDALTAGGHRVAAYHIVRDEPLEIDRQIRAWLGDGQIQVILTTGGTGIARRDTTVEVVERILEKKLDGFGELFRMLSWEQVGAAAMLSRAVGGIAGGTLIFAMPGSTKAVELAMTRLIVPELAHLVWELQR